METISRVKLLIGVYLGLGVVTLVIVWLLRDDHTAVTDAVWVRGTLVVISAAFLYWFCVKAERGSRAAYRRVRVIAATSTATIAVIVALPGAFPVWMRIDQAVLGVVLVGANVLVNRHELRARFARK